METLYRTRDVLRRRRLVREALEAAPGERILDVGCGPGFYLAELIEQVGPTGSLVGIDASPHTLALARHRTQGHDNVELHLADATALPVPDAAFDAALAVQVLEYVADPTPPWPSCTGSCAPVGVWSSGTWTGPRCPCTPPTPPGQSACSAPLTNTSPIRRCRRRSPLGSGRRASGDRRPRPRLRHQRVPPGCLWRVACPADRAVCREAGRDRGRGNRMASRSAGTRRSGRVLLRLHPVLLHRNPGRPA